MSRHDISGLSPKDFGTINGSNFGEHSDSLHQSVASSWHWDNLDFVLHYFFGSGRSIDLANVGLLDAFRTSPSVKAQIESFQKDLGRQIQNPAIIHEPYASGGQTDVTLEPFLFAVGHSTFYRSATCTLSGGEASCVATFSIHDSFTDPLDFHNVSSLLPNSDALIGAFYRNLPMPFALSPLPYNITASWNETIHITFP